MDPAVIRAILQSVIPAALLGAAVFACAWWPRKEPAAAPQTARNSRFWVGPLVLTAGVILTHFLLYGGLMPGRGSVSWYPAVALLAAVAGLVEGFVSVRAARLALRAGVLVWVGIWFTGPAHAGFDRALVIAALVSGGLAVIWGLHRLAERSSGPAAPAAGCLWATAISMFAMLLRSSQPDAYPAVSLAAALGAATAVSLLRPALSLRGGAMTTLGLIGCGNIYRALLLGEGPLWHAWIVLPLLALGAILPGLVAGREQKRTLVALGVAAFCSLGAAVLCFVLAPPPLEG